MLAWRSNLRDLSSATEIYTPHVFRGTCRVAMRATTLGTSTRKLGLMCGADLHGPHTYGNVMIPVVGEAACATGPSACAVSGGYGEMVIREIGRVEEGEKKRNGGKGPFIPSTNGTFLECDSSLAPSLTMSMSHALRLLCLFTRGPRFRKEPSSQTIIPFGFVTDLPQSHSTYQN